jgi:hypothetical protein
MARLRSCQTGAWDRRSGALPGPLYQNRGSTRAWNSWRRFTCRGRCYMRTRTHSGETCVCVAGGGRGGWGWCGR